MQALDSNTYYLNQHLFQQDLQQREWDMTKAEKREAIVELARKIVLQEIDRFTFEFVFGYYINDSFDKEEWFIATLEDIEIGICDVVLKNAIIREALVGASLYMFDCELEELLDDHLAYDPQIDSMVSEVNL